MLKQSITVTSRNAAASRVGAGVLGRRFAWSLVAVWTAAVATGMGLLAAYANNAGHWSPAPAAIGPSDDSKPSRHRLFMFLHPRCPCSVASVNELSRIVSQCAKRLDATVYFVRPASQPANWERGTLWNLASAIPGVIVKSDVDGAIAGNFHANTSGEVFVYDCRGKLNFHGGITAARGHAGENLGASEVIAIAMGERRNVERIPVFGCPFRAEVDDNPN